ncbi:histone-lysine N-methyltransferase ASHH2-like [Orbicella faveolata]|uniref:histone-lysine N-methyltransferase ASHH2-like n=1 Tax=Orbicella faveolata TaxID=48498 RepID=UPI0009E19C04|nr:histone-lysine N-methyltransferase ASHH2-like [Orbicella faveolata]
MDSSKIAVTEVTDSFLSCQAVEDVKSGSFLTDLWGPVLDLPTAYTVQVDENKHVLPKGMLAYFNHSCQPNAKFIFESRKISYPSLDADHEVSWYVVATRDIKKGEDVTYDYHTTEYDMAVHFQCNCAAETCLGKIKGFRYLSREQQKVRACDLSPVIKKLWNKP